MDIKSILKSFDLEDTVNSLTSHYNISGEQLSTISNHLFPLITSSIQKGLTDSKLMENLVKAGSSIDLSSIKGDASSLLNKENKNIGSDILTAILGGENRLAETIANLTNKTDLSYDTISEFLPSFSTLVVGAFLKNSGGLSSLVSSIFSGSITNGQEGDNSLQGILGRASQFLDQDGDGSVTDDLMNLKGKIFG